MSNRHTIISTTLGDLTLVAEGDTLIGLYFPGHWYLPTSDTLGDRVDPTTDAVFLTAREQLDDFLDGRRSTFDLPTATHGNEFQKKVWAMLEEIPFGETTTYGELATRLGDKNLARVVGQAVGHNPLSIVVPCHRVVGKNGKLAGYAGGIERKQTLLELEGPLPAQGRLV